MNPRASKPERVPIVDEKLRALILLFSRLTRCFTPLLWITRVHPMLAVHPRFPRETLAVLTVKNACVESALMSVRDLDDFFRQRTARDRATDIRADDFFDYQSPGTFLSEAERQSINQHVAHLTYQPVWAGKTGIPPDDEQNWNTAEFTRKALRAAFGLMDHLDRELSLKHPDKVDEITLVCGLWG